jgi:catechol 2,3-dioxygenase-like lactoylglutathione lyase family enzyme
MSAVTIAEITLADEPATWEAFGFEVEGERCRLGTIAVRLAGSGARRPGHGGGLAAWSLRGASTLDLDGLPTSASTTAQGERAPKHPNGVVAIDHLVAVTPDLDRTIAVLRAAGLDLRRVREEPTPAGAPRQGFFRLGEVILEVVQEPAEVIAKGGGADRPAHFWGLALLSDDLDATAAAFAPHCGEVRDAVQSGRRIATVRRSAGLSVPVALMSAAGEAVA